ncbi:hypothetical protein LRD18_05575 [Halorhodospira halochloris]|uniref:hypothetical protein n=1 Tax=Halorhodospira halochloris TaxID=1052 RepID=UPI001EE894A8|nr:hypothetical protein [Halorhodospira halochloris]MCG5530342.1 hypothetical protein [Halorhodospira halochloris]
MRSKIRAFYRRIISSPRAAETPHTEHSAGVSLGQDTTDRRLRQWQRSLRRVRISRNLLGIAWTAGPVTGLGLTGGYIVAYGHLPSTQLLIYFGTFTLLSGVIGLLAKIFYDSTLGSNKEMAQAKVVQVIDQLGELILATRDLDVDSLEGNARGYEAARQLLLRIDLSPQGVALACEELTKDRQLGRILAQIDNYRRAGLYSRIRDLNKLHGEYFEATFQQVRSEAPLAASALRERFTGKVPRLRAGIPRHEAFVERILAAFEEQNAALLTMQDVEQMFGLAFELLNGREITTLCFSYSGNWRLAKHLDRIEAARSRFRLNLAAVENRLRALASHLIEAGILAPANAPEELPSSTLLERINAALDGMQAELDILYKQHKRFPRTISRTQRARADHLSRTLATSIGLYRAAYQAVQSIGSTHAKLINATQDWEQLVAEMSTNREQQLKVGPGSKGLRITERSIGLDEDAREKVCASLSKHLFASVDTDPGRGYHQSIAAHEDLTPDKARRLAIEVAVALEPHIGITRSDVQRGLAATNACYLGDLEPGMSALEKCRIGEAMVREVSNDLGRAAEKLALALVRHYRVDLTEEAQSFLIEVYGARENVLNSILRTQMVDKGTQVTLLSQRPPPVPQPKREWYRSLVYARRILGQ